MEDPEVLELKPEELRWTCKEEDLPGEEGVGRPLEMLVGQERAMNAFKTGLSIDNPRFNMFVSGLGGAGKNRLLRDVIEQFADMQGRQMSDMVYVYNFQNPDQPKWLMFGAGKGKAFKKDMEDLIEDLRKAIPEALTGQSYNAQMKAVKEEYAQKEKELITDLTIKASEHGMGFGPNKIGSGFVVGMSELDAKGPYINPNLDTFLGKPKMGFGTVEREIGHNPAEAAEKLVGAKFEKYTQEDIDKMKEAQKLIMEDFEKASKQILEEGKRLKEKEKEIKTATVDKVVSPIVEMAKQGYTDNLKVLQHLDEMRADILEHLKPFEPQQEQQAQSYGNIMMLGGGQASPEEMLSVYNVNLFNCKCGDGKRPVVVEDNPHFKNLIGHIDKSPTMSGGVVASFGDVKPGSIARADDGYLLLDVYALFQHPLAWDALKRVLKTGELQVEEIYERVGLEAKVSVGMKPEPMPVNVKVIMTGDERAYQELIRYEPDFKDLFKIKVQFDSTIKNSKEGRAAYARLAKDTAQRENLLPVEKSGMASLIEGGAAMSWDRRELSTEFGELSAVLIEAGQLARAEGKGAITGDYVRKAFENKRQRSNLHEEKLQEMVAEGSLMIDAEGEKVGQVNGIYVLDLGDYAFGLPGRVTATTSVGKEGVVSLDREVKMSGPIHDKGSLIIESYLMQKFAQDKPLSLRAALSFEQSYHGIEGDSAEVTEFCAIISALAGVPVRQNVFMTGSANQHGEIQPIGGVNQKVEGVYDACQQRGLAGEIHVMIPYQNAKELMLRADLVEACEEGRLHIHVGKTFGDYIKVATGMEVGEELQEDGTFKEGTVFGLADESLKGYNYYATQKPKAPRRVREKKGLFGRRK